MIFFVSPRQLSAPESRGMVIAGLQAAKQEQICHLAKLLRERQVTLVRFLNAKIDQQFQVAYIDFSSPLNRIGSQ